MTDIVIVAKDNLHLTKECVKSALNQTLKSRVLVVDNESQDGTTQWLRSRIDVDCLCVVGPESLSYCWNLGMYVSLDSGVDVDSVLICNNDIVLRPDAVELLWEMRMPFVTGVSVDSKERMGTVGDRSIDIVRASARPHPDFSCFMITPETFKTVGPFEEEFSPAYFEDNEYHVRMHRAGITAQCVDVPFYHVGAATKANATTAQNVMITRGYERNRERFYKKYGCYPGTPEYSELFK